MSGNHGQGAELETAVRVTPPHPLGGRPAASAAEVMELGSMMGAMGAERGAVTSLLHHLQQITLQTHLQAMPKILEQVKQINRARINRIIQQVRLLPEAPVANGFWQRLGAPAGQPLPSYVNREQVLTLLAVAMEESPVMNVGNQ